MYLFVLPLIVYLIFCQLNLWYIPLFYQGMPLFNITALVLNLLIFLSIGPMWLYWYSWQDLSTLVCNNSFSQLVLYQLFFDRYSMWSSNFRRWNLYLYNIFLILQSIDLSSFCIHLVIVPKPNHNIGITKFLVRVVVFFTLTPFFNIICTIYFCIC